MHAWKRAGVIFCAVCMCIEEQSCGLQWERHPHRWTNRMETPHMKHDHWRKSSQWFGLKREHAELVMADTEIDTSFHDHCYPTTEEGWYACQTLCMPQTD